ncbi:MAG: hypothetical protein OHK0023_26290 [Anaerolineae bacterium]
MSNTYLVTGGMGCIGAWTLYHLVQQGKKAVNFDLSEDRQRIDLLMSRDEQAAITFIKGDLTDPAHVRAAFDTHGITHVIHLAALQIPFCRANPILGAQVNVVGTVNIFEAARHTGLKHIAFASSIAIYGGLNDYPSSLLPHDALPMPRTLYGVYKVANEGTARVYWLEQGMSSTTLRPHTVYGLGRDQGLTSEPTKAMQAAAKGENYTINYGGKVQMQYASDVAKQFIVASERPLGGALGYNLGTTPVPMAEIAQLIMRIKPNVNITYVDTPLPISEGTDGTELHRAFAPDVFETPLEEGIAATIHAFERLANT